MTAKEKEIKAKIKYWLEVSEMSRKELADKLGVTESALNGWLATRSIPPARWEEIKEIFAKYEQPERNIVVGTSLSDEEFAKMKQAAAIVGMTLEEFFRDCLLSQARKDLGKE